MIIHQTTAGGANPVRPYVIDNHIVLGIPNAKAINPYTGKNWEGIGVKPDYLIGKKEDALELAPALLKR